MTEQEWLIDKSALVRLAQSPDRDRWANRIERGLIHISTLTRLEIGYSAQSGDLTRREFREPPLAAMPVEYLTPKIEDRALEVRFCWPIGVSTAVHQFPTSSSRPPPSLPG